jgi:amino acid transporter
MIALAIICPPLYFLIQKKIGMFVITLAMALVGLALFLFIAPPLILWLIAAYMAIYHWKSLKMDKRMKQHAEMIGQQIAANLPRNDKTQ